MVDVKSDPFNPKLDKVATFKLYFSFSLVSPQIIEPWEMFFFLFSFFQPPFYPQMIEPWEMFFLFFFLNPFSFSDHRAVGDARPGRGHPAHHALPGGRQRDDLDVERWAQEEREGQLHPS